jgi:hypothetical protein
MIHPPSTEYVCPVIQRPAAEHNRSNVPTRSSGGLDFWPGMDASTAAQIGESLGREAKPLSISMSPGAIAFTLMLRETRVAADDAYFEPVEGHDETSSGDSARIKSSRVICAPCPRLWAACGIGFTTIDGAKTGNAGFAPSRARSSGDIKGWETRWTSASRR